MFDDDDDATCKKSVQKILWFDATTQNSFTLIAEGSNMSHYRATRNQVFVDALSAVYNYVVILGDP